jgi:pyruvate dehydrogenase phosphatase
MSHKIIAKEAEYAPRAVPIIKAVLGEEYISVVSPVKPLSYEEADTKIRDGADSFSFNAAGGCLGRVDVVSLGTKIPCEDRWDVGVMRGEDGQDTLYAGVYDGHK